MNPHKQVWSLDKLTLVSVCLDFSSGRFMQSVPLNPINTALRFEPQALSSPWVVNLQHTLTICSCVKNKDMKRKQSKAA